MQREGLRKERLRALEGQFLKDPAPLGSDLLSHGFGSGHPGSLCDHIFQRMTRAALAASYFTGVR